MAKKNPIVVALDIGTTTIRVVVAEQSAITAQPTQFSQSSGSSFGEEKLHIIGIGTCPSQGLRKGVIINIEATVASISKALSQAETMAGCEIDSVYASISGSHIRGFNSHGIVGIKHKEVSQNDVDKVIEAAKAVAIPLDREVLHVLPQEFLIDEQDGIREPLGIAGVRLESKVHIISGAVASAQNVVKCANRCGLDVNDIVLSSLASAKAVLSQEEQELGVAMLDIGGGTTDIIVYQGGAVRHTSVLSVGGAHITNDIAAGLRTPLSAAEEIKCKYGMALLTQVGKDETIEVPSTGGRPPRVLSKHVLCEIIEPRVNEILTLVQKDLIRAGCDSVLTSGLVITGGTANLSGLAEAAEHIFNIPVRVGIPTGMAGLTDLLRGPESATAAGLVMYGAQTDGAFSRRSGGSTSILKTLKKVGNWVGEHF